MDKANLRQATSFFDFIDVDLYQNPDRFTIKNMKYWIWSEKNQELQEHILSDMVRYEMIEKYVEKGLVWII